MADNKPYVGESGREYETFSQMVTGEPEWAAAEIRELRQYAEIMEEMLLRSLPPYVPKIEWLRDVRSRARERACAEKDWELVQYLRRRPPDELKPTLKEPKDG